jgi:hypothetical protein
MNIRVAEIKDISQIQVVRNLVKENRLSDPAQFLKVDCAGLFNPRQGMGL